MAGTADLLQSDEAPAAQAEANELDNVNFDELEAHERVGALEKALRNSPRTDPLGGAQEETDVNSGLTTGAESPDGEPAAEPVSNTDEFDAKFAALQAKAEAERERVAGKKHVDTERVKLRKQEEELASIAYKVLEEQKTVGAAMAKVQAYEKMTIQELVYEAMQRSGGDANAVAEAFLAMNDPTTIAGIQAKKRESETVNPMQKRLDDLEARLAAKEQEATAATQQSQMYAELNAAASLSQQHAEEVPHVAKLAVKNQQLFTLRYNQARNILMQEHGQAPTGNVLLRMEEDLAPELNEIRETFGWGELPGSVQSSSSPSPGRVQPKMVTNRAASQRTQVAEEGDGLPDDVRERARLLEQRLRG